MIKLSFGDVRKKKIVTRNHFISHMIEHVAWRMGLSIELEWGNENWRELGQLLGAEIKRFSCNTNEAAALGMIDDGSASVAVVLNERNVEFSAVGGVDLEWFLRSRCEQLNSGEPLIELAQGLSAGLNARISVQIWSVEDPHHTWEGIYRGIGSALSKIFTPQLDPTIVSTLRADLGIEVSDKIGEVAVLEKGMQRAKVQRGTAESGVSVSVDLLGFSENLFQIEVDRSIKATVQDVEKIFNILAKALDAELIVDFKAISLSSSHVVMEDIGLVMGRALLEILKTRMEKYGVNGAGSNLNTPYEIQEKNVRVGISAEGRKFWRLIPEDGSYEKLRRDFVIGQDVLNGLRSEDLDDFLDGLAGGMCSSIVVHIRDYSKPSAVWQEIFQALGVALREMLIVNPYRRGVPPGVKATFV